MGEKTAIAKIRENKFSIGFFDWGLQGVNATLIENFVQNPYIQ